jgi:hypothetical protein
VSDRILVKVDGQWTDDPAALAASISAGAAKDELQTRLIAALEAEIARLREERKQIMRRRWVVRCGHYDDATSILGAIRGARPPLVIEWADDDGNVDQVEQMQPLPPGPEVKEVSDG